MKIILQLSSNTLLICSFETSILIWMLMRWLLSLKPFLFNSRMLFPWLVLSRLFQSMPSFPSVCQNYEWESLSETIAAMSRENLSSGFSTRIDSNWPALSQKLISDIETRGITLSRQRTTMVLIRLRESTGWSAPLLFTYGINRFFYHDMAHCIFDSLIWSTCLYFPCFSCVFSRKEE